MSEPEAGSRWGLRLTIAVLTLVVAALLAEGALRLFWRNPYVGESAKPIVELHTQPKNANRVLERSVIDPSVPSVTFRTNDRGYIEPALRFRKPAHTIAFLGGSTTECSYVQENLRFPALTSFLLEKKGLQVNVLNMGVSGNDSHHSINNLLNWVAPDAPDVVVFMHAANDVGHLRAVGGYEFAMGNSPTLSDLGRLFLPKVSAYSSLVALARHVITVVGNKRILERGRAATDEAQPEAPLDEARLEKYRQRLRTFVAVARAFNMRPVLMTEPNGTYRNELTPQWIKSSDQALFNKTIRDVAAAERVDLIDLVAFLQDKERQAGKFEKPVFYDAIHVTDFGSTLYAGYIANRLSEMLAGPAPKR